MNFNPHLFHWERRELLWERGIDKFPDARKKNQIDRSPDRLDFWGKREGGWSAVCCLPLFSPDKTDACERLPEGWNPIPFGSLGGYHSMRALHKAGKAPLHKGNVSDAYLDVSAAPHPTHPLLPTVPLIPASWVSCRSFSFISLRTERAA